MGVPQPMPPRRPRREFACEALGRLRLDEDYVTHRSSRSDDRAQATSAAGPKPTMIADAAMSAVRGGADKTPQRPDVRPQSGHRNWRLMVATELTPIRQSSYALCSGLISCCRPLDVARHWPHAPSRSVILNIDR